MADGVLRVPDPGERRDKAALRVLFGRPVRIVDEGQVRALLDLGARAELGSGRRVAVFRYGSRAAAEAYAEFNRVRYRLRVLGPFDTVLGPVNVIDLGEAGSGG